MYYIEHVYEFEKKKANVQIMNDLAASGEVS
jgi:hypothetical protein